MVICRASVSQASENKLLRDVIRISEIKTSEIIVDSSGGSPFPTGRVPESLRLSHTDYHINISILLTSILTHRAHQ